MRDYVPLGELEVGTVLHVQGGGEAILVSKTWRQGDFEVFDFEVEGLHNFYVRGEWSDAAGVLVHNSTGGKPIYRGVHGKSRQLGDAKQGVARPSNPDANITPEQHNRGTYYGAGEANPEFTGSQYTSWTTDRKVAENAAWKSGPGGVVLETSTDCVKCVASPDFAAESEVLVEGVVTGAKVTDP